MKCEKGGRLYAAGNRFTRESAAVGRLSAFSNMAAEGDDNCQITGSHGIILDTYAKDAKYEMIVELANCVVKGYHEFGIKLPVGACVLVEREVGGRDEFALLCRVPHDLSQDMLDKTMHSRSRKKSYQVRDVIGQPIGRVQYFLNKTLVEGMVRGTISKIEGIITGDPKTSKKPPMMQKWKNNRQAGGGAVIPCTWRLYIKEGSDQFRRVSDMVKAIRSVAKLAEDLDEIEIRVMTYKKDKK